MVDTEQATTTLTAVPGVAVLTESPPGTEIMKEMMSMDVTTTAGQRHRTVTAMSVAVGTVSSGALRVAIIEPVLT